MKNVLKQAVCAVLSAALIISVFSFNGACEASNKKSIKRYENLNGKNWMSGISDDRFLYEINIPGSHDSATANCKNSTNNFARIFGTPVLNTGKYAKTQSLTLSQQLNAGVRYLDLRFSPKQEKLLLCHGNAKKAAFALYAAEFLSLLNPIFIVCVYLIYHLDIEFYAYEDEACTIPLTCDSALAQIKDFLKDNPTETVILSAKKENGNTEDFVALFKEQIQKLKTQKNPSTHQEYLYSENGRYFYTKMPVLSEVRGKIVLMSPEYEALGAGDVLDAGNGEGQSEFMGTSFNYENHWNISADKKVQFTENFIEKYSQKMSKDPKKHLTYANVLKTNSNAVLRQSPYEIAKQINENIYSENKLKKGHYYGWIMGDFMSRKVCRAIWQTNYFEFENDV